MIPFTFAIGLSLLGLVVGYVIRAAQEKPKHPNTQAPYFKGNGDPQPYEWRPELADVLRRKGAV